MDWEPRFKPSWLCLKQHGPKKAVVVRIHPDAILGSGKARMYEGWVGDRKVSDPADVYKVGQVVRLDDVREATQMESDTLTEPTAEPQPAPPSPPVQYQPQVSPPPAHETVEDTLKAAGCPPSTAQQLAGMGMSEAQARGWAAQAQSEGVGWAGLRADVFNRGPAAFDNYRKAE